MGDYQLPKEKLQSKLHCVKRTVGGSHDKPSDNSTPCYGGRAPAASSMVGDIRGQADRCR